MTELTPQARAFFEMARHSDQPTAADRQRVRADLLPRIAALGAAGAAGTAGANAAGATGASALAGSSTGKLSIVLAFLIGAGAGGVTGVLATSSNSNEAPTETGRAPATLDQNPPSNAAPPGAPGRGSPNAGDELSGPAKPAATPVSRDPTSGPQPPPRTASSCGASCPPDDTLASELALVRQAHEALRAGRPQDAVVFLEEHAARYPSGALSEERTGARVLAECATGGAGAPAAAERFLARNPHSPLAARIRSACRR